MSSRYEELLKALLNGETANIVPRSRAEAALKNCIEGCGCDGLNEPKSVIEAYLQALAEKLKGGGGGGSTLPSQEKTVDITENGTVEVTPDYGYTLSKVTAIVNVESESKTDFFVPTNDVEIFVVTEYGTLTLNEISVEFGGSGNAAIQIVQTLPEKLIVSNVADYIYGYVVESTGIAYADFGDGVVTAGTLFFMNDAFDKGWITDINSVTEYGVYCVLKNSGVDKIQRYIELNGNSAEYMFYQFKGTSVDELIAGIDASIITNMSNMFYGCSKMTTVPLFDTSQVLNMSYMFGDCSSLTTVPLFDTSKVMNMSYMFYGCSKMTTVPLFDTSRAMTMYYMFYGCSSLTTVPLFDTSQVSNIGSMFYKCSKLTTVPSFDLRGVTWASNAGDMFYNCAALTECWLRNIKANLTVGSGTSYGHLLTLESLLHLCKECRKSTSSLKLTVGTANLEKLANVYVKLIDITDEMRAEDDLIDEKYPFVQCESTDADAMTIQDYMALKMWSIA